MPYCLQPHSDCDYCELNCIISQKYTNISGECTLDQERFLVNPLVIDGINVRSNVVILIKEKTCLIKHMKVQQNHPGNSNFTIKFENDLIKSQNSNVNFSVFISDKITQLKFQNLNILGSEIDSDPIQIQNIKNVFFDNCSFNHHFFKQIYLSNSIAVVNNFKSSGQGGEHLFMVFQESSLKINFENLTIEGNQLFAQVKNNKSKLILVGKSFSIIDGKSNVFLIQDRGLIDIQADFFSIEKYKDELEALILIQSYCDMHIKIFYVLQIIQNNGIIISFDTWNTVQLQAETIKIENNILQSNYSNASLFFSKSEINQLFFNATNLISIKNNNKKVILFLTLSWVYLNSYDIDISDTQLFFYLEYYNQKQSPFTTFFIVDARNSFYSSNSSIIKTDYCEGQYNITAKNEIIYQNSIQSGGYFYEGNAKCQSKSKMIVKVPTLNFKNCNLFLSKYLEANFNSNQINFINTQSHFIFNNTIQFKASQSIYINTLNLENPFFFSESQYNIMKFISSDSIQFEVASNSIIEFQDPYSAFSSSSANITFNQPAKYSICQRCSSSQINFQYSCAYEGYIYSCLQNCLQCTNPQYCNQCKPGYEISQDSKQCYIPENKIQILNLSQDQ